MSSSFFLRPNQTIFPRVLRPGGGDVTTLTNGMCLEDMCHFQKQGSYEYVLGWGGGGRHTHAFFHTLILPTVCRLHNARVTLKPCANHGGTTFLCHSKGGQMPESLLRWATPLRTILLELEPTIYTLLLC